MDKQSHNYDKPESVPRRQLIKKLGAAFSVIGSLVWQTGCGRGEAPKPQNASTEGRDFMPTRTQMKNLFKQRISWDDPDTFNSNSATWNTVRLGIYYDEDDELINIVVYETTALAAGMEDRYLPDDVWRNLIAKVGPTHTPEEAVDPMMDAAMRAKPVPPGEEPPAVNRPRSRPTLKSARPRHVRG